MHQPVEIELKFLRLNSGEDIISETCAIDDNTIRIINPMKIIYMVNENMGMMSISLAPWIFNKISESDYFDMGKHNILVSSKISIQMTKSYYGLLNRLKNNIEDEDDNEYDDDITEEDLKETKEMLNQAIQNKKRLH